MTIADIIIVVLMAGLLGMAWKIRKLQRQVAAFRAMLDEDEYKPFGDASLYGTGTSDTYKV